MILFNFNGASSGKNFNMSGDFGVNQFGYGSILVDVMPESPVNDNYFKEII